MDDVDQDAPEAGASARGHVPAAAVVLVLAVVAVIVAYARHTVGGGIVRAPVNALVAAAIALVYVAYVFASEKRHSIRDARAALAVVAVFVGLAAWFWYPSPPDDLVVIPAVPGDAAGSDGDLAAALVERRLWIQRHEVTRSQWSAFAAKDSPGAPCPDCPVDRVSWADAARFANWRSRKEKLPPCYVFESAGQLCRGQGADRVCVHAQPGCLGYRLPTADEWFHASRLGDDGQGDAFAREAAGHYEEMHARAKSAGVEMADPASVFREEVLTAEPLPEAPFPIDRTPPDSLGSTGMRDNVDEWCEQAAVDARPRRMRPVCTPPSLMDTLRGNARAWRKESMGKGHPRVGFRLVRAAP